MSERAQPQVLNRQTFINTRCEFFNLAACPTTARSGCAFPSIPARHDLARRVDANWIAGLVVHGMIDIDEAEEMIRDTAYRLAKKAYKL